VLESGAYARRPLIDKLPLLDTKLDVLFLYGDRDWMEFSAREKAAELLHAQSSEDRNVRVTVIADAGHHLYYDNVKDFWRKCSRVKAAGRRKLQPQCSCYTFGYQRSKRLSNIFKQLSWSQCRWHPQTQTRGSVS
jgi:hypothetical protein